MERRTLLRGIAAGLLVGPSNACAAEESSVTGPSPRMVTGPFPPVEFEPTVRGRPNPGAWIPVAENDLDLALVRGAAGAPRGQVVTLEVRVLTGADKPVSGAQVELWQADAKGFYNHRTERRVSPAQLDPSFGYWGSATTGEDGRVQVRTVVPGAYPAGDGWWRPPHLHWSIGAQGVGEVTTQSYFDGEALDDVAAIRKWNDDDLILHFRESFARGLDRNVLQEARRRSLEELVVQFAKSATGTTSGSLTLRI